MTKKIPYILIFTLFAIIALVVFYIFNPEQSGFFPPCPFKSLTGFDCPGCGSQRAFHYLLHFEIKEAFLRNPLMVTAIPYLVVGFYFEYFGGKQRHPKTRKFLFGKNAIVIISCIIVLYWIGRNVLPHLL